MIIQCIHVDTFACNDTKAPHCATKHTQNVHYVPLWFPAEQIVAPMDLANPRILVFPGFVQWLDPVKSRVQEQLVFSSCRSLRDSFACICTRELHWWKCKGFVIQLEQVDLLGIFFGFERFLSMLHRWTSQKVNQTRTDFVSCCFVSWTFPRYGPLKDLSKCKAWNVEEHGIIK